MSTKEYRSKRPLFAAKPARAEARDALAHGLHAAAERFTLADPGGDPGAVSLVTLNPVREAYQDVEDAGAPYDYAHVLECLLRGIGCARESAQDVGGERLGDIVAKLHGDNRRRIAKGRPAGDEDVERVIGELEILEDSIALEDAYVLGLLRGLDIDKHGGGVTTGYIMWAQPITCDVTATYEKARHAHDVTPGITAGRGPEVISIGNFVTAPRVKGHK
jgi:hypothetical protein